jgi:hypothetical protein
MRYPSLLKSLLFVLLLAVVPAVSAQQADADASRQKTRDRLNQLLTRISPELKINFKQSEKAPFAFVGTLAEGLKNCDNFEIVIRITTNETIGIKAFPHYKNGYINIDKARNPTQLMRQLMQLNETTFLFWGADDTGDVFTGYTFTLESGFPDEAIRIVLASIKNSDETVGKLRPSIDGTNP